METVSPTNSPATEAALDRLDVAIEDKLGGHPSYPSGTAFVPADHPELADTIRRYIADGQSVVLVYDKGREQLLGDPHRLMAFVVGPWLASLREHGSRFARRLRGEPTFH